MGSNVDTIKALYEAFGRGDVPAVLGTMDDKVEWKEPPGLAPTFTDQIGPQAVAENVFGQVMTLVNNFSVAPEEFVDGGDIVIVIGHYQGTGAKTGKDFEARLVHVWRFGADGKITGFETITDTAIWQDALDLG